MPTDWILPLVTLTAMEIVLGIDNVIFIAIIAARLPKEQQGKARQLGLMVALGTRLLLLCVLSYLLGLENVIVIQLSNLGIPEAWLPREVDIITLKDVVLLGGGLFLIAKSTFEIHDKLEGGPDKVAGGKAKSFGWTLVQIAMVDIVFSLDSVITAVGMATPEQLWVMVTAMIISVGVMLFFAGPISNFVYRHPTVKMLALSFLILIGVMLVAEGLGHHINRGYIYFAMAFSLVVELLNLKLRAKAAPVHLHGTEPVDEGAVKGG